MADRCTKCGTNYTASSRQEYRAAPGWNNECPKCTKEKFSTYLASYLPEMFPRGMCVELIREYFGNITGLPVEDDDIPEIAAKVLALIEARRGKAGTKNPTTAGHAIAMFVKQLDAEVKSKGRSAISVKNTRFAFTVFIIGLSIIVLSVLLIFFR